MLELASLFLSTKRADEAQRWLERAAQLSLNE